MTKEELIKHLKDLNINLTETQLNQIDDFCMFLLSENKKYNLTAIRSYEEVLLKHVYDSLTLSLVVNLVDYERLLDIGSGAGFPGIILKIVYPHLNITLLDSNGKKTTFLNKVKERLGLKDLEIINDRAEVFIKNRRDSYDIITARAVANLDVLLELAIPFLKLNGIFIAMKANIHEELESGKSTCEVLNAKIIDTYEFKLPLENSNRTLVVTEKCAATDLKYPRCYDQIIKKPLKKKNK